MSRRFFYDYNDAELLIRKSSGYGITDYYYNGDQLLSQVNGNVQLDFFYDSYGDLLGFDLNGVKYYYVFNMTRDIIGILDSDGNQVVSYIYDSWGKLISTSGSLAESVGRQNPFWYAGYYYDQETGFYYIESRYYDPGTHRFLNADDTAILTDGNTEFVGYNLFAYTGNNPINFYDPNGHESPGSVKTLSSLLVMAMACGAVLGSVAGPLGAVLGSVAVGTIAMGMILRVSQIKTSIYFTKILRQLVQIRKKSNNLPSYKNININMDHIMSGHSSGGNRGGPNKDRFPVYLSRYAIRKAIITAYRYGKKIRTQGDRVFIRGPWGRNYIEMWVNVVTKIIESAWPKWK